MTITTTTENLYLSLDGYSLRQPDDPVKPDLELVCDRCDEHLCDAEPGDGLDTLARVTDGHQCGATHTAPCGATFDTAREASDHQWHCDQCAGAVEQQVEQQAVEQQAVEQDTVERFIVVKVTAPAKLRGRHSLDSLLADAMRDAVADASWPALGIAATAEIRDPREVIDPEESTDGERNVIDGLPACQLTCSETEALAQVLRRAGHDTIAERLINEHGAGDDDAEDEHHDLYDPEHACA